VIRCCSVVISLLLWWSYERFFDFGKVFIFMTLLGFSGTAIKRLILLVSRNKFPYPLSFSFFLFSVIGNKLPIIHSRIYAVC